MRDDIPVDSDDDVDDDSDGKIEVFQTFKDVNGNISKVTYINKKTGEISDIDSG